MRLTSIHIPLEEYLAAKQLHAEAQRLYYRAWRTFTKLSDRSMDEDRAYKLAGVGLADVRALAADKARRQARDRLKRYTLGLDDFVEQILVFGAVMCADYLPKPAND